MDNRNKAGLSQTLRRSAAIPFITALVMLVLSASFLSGRPIDMLMPLLLTMLFGGLSLLLDRIPLTRDRKWLRLTLKLLCAVLAGLLLGL